VTRQRANSVETLDTAEEYRRRFDALFARGSSAVLAGSHYHDSPPVDGGRWRCWLLGVSGIFGALEEAMVLG
jgi:hypothetical protein